MNPSFFSFSLATLGSADAGVPAPAHDAAHPALSPEDLEVIENLELLQNLEGASDLELLQELSLDR
jgi:hypothetical protein